VNFTSVRSRWVVERENVSPPPLLVPVVSWIVFVALKRRFGRTPPRVSR
jgi:hypothetical protein